VLEPENQCRLTNRDGCDASTWIAYDSILDHVSRVIRPLQMSTSIYKIRPERFRVHRTYDVRVLPIGSSTPINMVTIRQMGLDPKLSKT
jgi:hypothetical protein